MIRSLRQPGPAHPSRIDWCRGDIVPLRFVLAKGMMLNDAVTGPLTEAGLTSGTVVFRELPLNPFRYVMPGPSPEYR